MVIKQPWTEYPKTYRAKEMKILISWITSGESGSVIGLLGSGRSNLLGFLCYRPDAIQLYLSEQAKSIALVSVDLNNLPDNNLSALYRVILRSFYRVRNHFDQKLQELIIELYQKNQRESDAFLSQSALQELLLQFEMQQTQVVLVLNRFERFCQYADKQMVNTLRGLRDDFKDTLCYLVGMAQEVSYFTDISILGDMYDILDSHLCWIGAMEADDALNVIKRATKSVAIPPNESEVRTILSLTGGFPSLLKATCHWWLNTDEKPVLDQWIKDLEPHRSIQHRLNRIWAGLTQEEQFVLSELQKLQTVKSPSTETTLTKDKNKHFDKKNQKFIEENRLTLNQLVTKGVCYQKMSRWYVQGDLLAEFVAKAEGRGRGRIWLDEDSGELYQGQTLLKDLNALERAVLSFLVKNPQTRFPKTELIINTWPDELRREGVTDNSLYQVIFTIRRAIEPNPSDPSYLLSWRGKPEGGYQFFPEGRPR